MEMKNRKDLTGNERIRIDLILKPDQIFERKKKRSSASASASALFHATPNDFFLFLNS